MVFVLSEEKFNAKRFIEYLSFYDLNAFPSEMRAKENDVVFGDRSRSFGVSWCDNLPFTRNLSFLLNFNGKN